MNKISVVIVTYNSQDYIKKCIESFIKNDLIKEVIIIDNNSSDESCKEVRTISNKKIRFIINTTNVGFSKAVNQGISISNGDYILLVNPDTILNSESICDLYRLCKEKVVGVVGGKQLRLDGSVHGSYVRKPNISIFMFDFTNLSKIFPNNYWHKKFYYLDQISWVQPTEVDVVSGGYMLIKKEILKRIGLFDENFYMYLEDIDFCNRVKGCGYKVIFSPDHPIVHIGGASSNNRIKTNIDAWIDSRRYYLKKYFPKYFQIITPLIDIESFLMKLRIYNRN